MLFIKDCIERDDPNCLQYRLWGSHEDATKGLKQLRKDVTDDKYVSEIPNFEIPKEITDLVPKYMGKLDFSLQSLMLI